MSATPVVIPELGAAREPIEISCWLIDPAEAVDIGERILELLIRGVTVDVTADACGVLRRVSKWAGDVVVPGETVAWIEEDGAAAV